MIASATDILWPMACCSQNAPSRLPSKTRTSKWHICHCLLYVNAGTGLQLHTCRGMTTGSHSGGAEGGSRAGSAAFVVLTTTGMLVRILEPQQLVAGETTASTSYAHWISSPSTVGGKRPDSQLGNGIVAAMWCMRVVSGLIGLSRCRQISSSAITPMLGKLPPPGRQPLPKTWMRRTSRSLHWSGIVELFYRRNKA